MAEVVSSVILAGGYLVFPLLGLVWLANRRERERQERLLRDAVRVVVATRLARGSRRRM